MLTNRRRVTTIFFIVETMRFTGGRAGVFDFCSTTVAKIFVVPMSRHTPPHQRFSSIKSVRGKTNAFSRTTPAEPDNNIPCKRLAAVTGRAWSTPLPRGNPSASQRGIFGIRSYLSVHVPHVVTQLPLLAVRFVVAAPAAATAVRFRPVVGHVTVLSRDRRA